MNAKRAVALVGLVLLCATLTRAHAQLCHGIPVYQGARLDTAETNFARAIGGADAYCYRTEDGVEKVTAFYRKQSGLIFLGGDTTGARFIHESDNYRVYIVITSPWPSAKTGELNRDTSVNLIKE